MENKITLNLHIDDINVVLSALGRMPYEAVFKLIAELRNQVTPQLQQQNPDNKE